MCTPGLAGAQPSALPVGTFVQEKKELPWLGLYNGPRAEADRSQTSHVRVEQNTTEHTKFLCKLVPHKDNSEQRLILQSLIFLSD